MPVTITRPCALRIASTVATNGAPSRSHIAAESAVTPSRSVSSVRSAEATCGLASGFMVFASGELTRARCFTKPTPLCATLTNSQSELAARLDGYFSRLFGPGGEGVVESAVARRAFFDRENGAAAVGVHNWNVKPFLILEQLHIALLVGVDRRQADEEKSVCYFHRKSCQRGATGLFRLFHQDAGYIGDASAGEVGGQVEHDL